jgi:opacity protein-like surface antigen
LCDTSARATTSFYKVGDVSFLAESGNWGRNSTRLGAGLNVALPQQWYFRADYDYEAFDYTATSEFGISLGVNW